MGFFDALKIMLGGSKHDTTAPTASVSPVQPPSDEMPATLDTTPSVSAPNQTPLDHADVTPDASSGAANSSDANIVTSAMPAMGTMSQSETTAATADNTTQQAGPLPNEERVTTAQNDTITPNQGSSNIEPGAASNSSSSSEKSLS